VLALQAIGRPSCGAATWSISFSGSESLTRDTCFRDSLSVPGQVRTGISRAAEAMTVFAVMIATLFVLIHLGRPWVVYWVIPYPISVYLWPDFQSPLVFDFLAVNTYFVVSLLFWYTGLVPDLASVRDRTSGIRQKIYGLFSLGWSGTHRQWQPLRGLIPSARCPCDAARNLRAQRCLLDFALSVIRDTTAPSSRHTSWQERSTRDWQWSLRFSFR